MAEIIASLEPGRYPTGQTLTVTFPPGSRKAIVTRTDKAPILTEVLAYDTGPITPNPPEAGPPGPSVERPFLVVTQDGRGNVVYDGGFPKFYNTSLKNAAGAWPSALPSTFAELTAASKYMYNAFNFCASKSKVGNGNRKVLLINNADRGYDYYILGSHFNPYAGQTPTNELYGFKDTFDAICAIGGWEPTYYTYTGSMIDLSYDELDQYTHIVYLSSQGGLAVPAGFRCTENFANNVATYRAAGNGVIIITDHTNYNFTSVDDALARSDGFVPDANRLAAKYDCYFSGNVNRQPVSVGEIRRQIGLPGPPENHPLLANLSDSEFIFAGGSESVIFPKIYTDEIVPENQPLVVPMLTVGTYRVNVLIQLENGDILTKPMLFTIIDPSAIQLHDSFNRVVTPTSQTYKLAIDYSLHYLTDPSLTLTGEIRRNGVLQGYFRVVKAITTYMPFAGVDKPLPANSGDVITLTIKEPFEYNESITLNVPDGNPYYAASGTVAGWIGKIRQHPYFADIPTVDVIMADLQAFSNRTYSMSGLIGPSANRYYWKTIGKGRLPFTTSALVNVQLAVYTDAASWEANKPAFGNVGDAAIVANSNTVYYWENLSAVWVQHPQLASALFGIGRNVKDTRSSNRWYINANTTNIIP